MKRTKPEWRRTLLAARAAIPEATRRENSAAILSRVAQLSCFAAARSILGYEALGAEADPAGILGASLRSGRAVFFPSANAPDGDAVWVGRAAQAAGEQVCGLSAGSLVSPVVALVPGVGFDIRGVRLGRGQGFYDRALLELRRAGQIQVVALAFECQIVDELPSDPWDERVDFVVSEKRLLTLAVTAGVRGETSAGWS